MARDRQRAKQRRRRQPGAGGPAAGGARPRPRPADEADSVFPQRGDVQPVEGDEALEDETVDYEEAVETAPGRVDPAVDEERRAHHDRRGRSGIIAFLGHVVDELRRVQWPDRRHVGQGTAVVLGFVVIAGSYLGLLDAIWKPLIQAIL